MIVTAIAGTSCGGPRRLPVGGERPDPASVSGSTATPLTPLTSITVAGWMTAEKEPTNMYKSKSGGAPSDGQAREK